MKRLLIPIAILSLVVFGSWGTAYAISVFTSNQVGASPSNGFVLQTNGINSTWVATSTLGFSSGSGTPGGASSTIQYNANGAFAGNTGFVYNGTNVGIGTSSPYATLSVGQTNTANGTVFAISSSTAAGNTPLLTIASNGVANFYTNGGGNVLGPGAFIINANTAPSSLSTVAHNASLHIIGPDNDFGAMYIDSFGSFGSSGGQAYRSVIELRAARGTLAAKTPGLVGDELGRIAGRSFDGTNWTGSLAAMSFVLAENLSATSQGTYIAFRTTALGAVGGGSVTVPPEVARVQPSGGLSIGDTVFDAVDPGHGVGVFENGLGVGTSTPWRALSVGTANAGTFAISTSTAGCAQFSTLGELFSTGTNCGSGSSITGTQGQVAYFQGTNNAVGTSSIFILPSGFVGIGTTSPNHMLTLSGSDSGTSLTTTALVEENIVNWDQTVGNNAQFAFDMADSAGGVVTGAKIAGVFTSHTSGAASADLAFITRNAGTQSEKMRILSNGTVGIGTSAPIATLGIHGNLSVDNLGGQSQFSYIGDRQFNGTPLALTDPTDVLVVSTTSSNAKRALAITSIASGGTGGNVATQGFNATAIASSTVLGNLTGAGTGGNLRNRLGTMNFLPGFNVNTASALTMFCQVAGNLSSTTNCIGSNYETPTVAAGDLITNNYAALVNGGAVSGTITNNNGFYVQNLVAGLNQVAFGTAENASTTCANCNYAFSATGTAQSYFAGNVGVGSTTPGSLLSIGGSGTGTNFYDNATTTKNGVGGENINDGCYAFKGTCLSTGGGGSGTVTSIATNNGITGGTITTTGTIGLAAIAANSVLGNITGASGVPSAIATSSLFLNASAVNTGLLTSTDWTTFNGKGNGTVTSVATNSTLTGGTITTTGTLGINLTNPNSWTGVQTFVNASTTNLTASGKIYVGPFSFVDQAANVLQWSVASLFPQGTGHLGTNVHPWLDLAVTGFVIDSTGHIVTSGTKPTLSSCGTTNSISGNDNNGTIIFTGTLVTACTMMLATAVPAGQTIECQASTNTTSAFAFISATSTTAITFGTSATLSAGTIFYACQRHQ